MLWIYNMRMTIEQIRCVLAVAESGSFTAASRVVSLSQSAVSKKIALLERELGVVLFDRTTRNVQPTSAGKNFVHYAGEIVRNYDLLTSSLRSYHPTGSKRLIIGSIYFSPEQSIAPYVALYAHDHPATEIETVYNTTTPLMDALSKGEIDVAIVSSMYTSDEEGDPPNFSRDARFLSYSLAVDPYYLVVSKRHRLAEHKIADYGDLQGEKLITLDRNMDVYHRSVNRIFEEEGIEPEIAVKSGSIAEALLLVSQDVGVAIFSTRATGGAEGVRLIRMRRPLLRDTQIVIRRETNPPSPIKSFFAYMKNSYR